jgi:predicted nucleic acid-binding protein
MLVDANLLLYAVDETAAQHARAKQWLEDILNGPRRVGLPWQSLTAFVRIATHPRALQAPMSATDAWSFVDDWLGAPVAWVPCPVRDIATCSAGSSAGWTCEEIW